jgi:electron-transferring-flavoprotein dehydrogenase
MQRETLETDVLIVGAGPAGLSCAIRLAQLFKSSEGQKTGHGFSPEKIYLLEKADQIGAHNLSGAILDPRALRELVPDFGAQGAPLESPVTADAVLYLTRRGGWKLPITPPAFKNHGNYVVSLNKLVQWLGGLAEKAGVSVLPGTAGAEVLYESDRVVGVRTDDKGIDRDGKHKSNFQPGYDLRAQVTVFAEGPRGSLAKQLVSHLKLDEASNPQVYTVGVKELWEIPAGRVARGEVIHTAGWPLTSRQFGGGFIYALSETLLSVGLVVGVDNEDPRFDPHETFQRFKTHRRLARLLEGGKLIRYGAKTIPEGGYFSIPRTSTDGALIIGDSAGFLNSQRLKGIHLAMKSGMLAAETIFEALQKNSFTSAALGAFDEKWQSSWIKDELWKVRNFHQGFDGGFWSGLLHAALQQFTGGRGVRARYRTHAGHERMRHASESAGRPRVPFKADGKLTFNRLSDVYHSSTHHEEDQPSHLKIADFDICNSRCTIEYGNPCQHFCPAEVYEMAEAADGAGPRLKLNPSNCVHCKTCDIADPYQIITWVPPEGGGGPHYDGM